MLERSFTVDVLKVVAAQLIVWHHFAAYGPMADSLHTMWPHTMIWLYENARLAVQVFLVVGGYLAAQSMTVEPMQSPWRLIAKRYLRLVPLFVLSLALISLAVEASRAAVQASWLPSEVSLWQFLAHALLLHDMLGFEALSSGVWYVAIDFQLYVLWVLMCHSFQRPKILSLAVALLCVASMWHFNRAPTLDIWAPYFFCAYGLGVLAAWAKRSSFDKAVFWIAALLGIGALWLAFRSRLCLAVITAVVLVIKPIVKPTGLVHRSPVKRLIHRLSNSAYALFLSHFGVIVLFSYMWTISDLYHPYTALGVLVLAWLCSVALGLFMYENAEVPLHHFATRTGKRSAPSR